MPPGTGRAFRRVRATRPVVMVAPHTRVRDIAQMLEQSGALKSGIMFEFDLRLPRAGRQDQGRRICHSVSASMHTTPPSCGRQVHPAQADRRRRPDQRLIWKLVQKNDVLTGDAGPCRKKAACCRKPIFSPAAKTRAHLLAKMRARTTPSWRKMGKPHQRVAAGQPARGHHPGFHRGEGTGVPASAAMSPPSSSTGSRWACGCRPTHHHLYLTKGYPWAAASVPVSWLPPRPTTPM